MITRLQSTWMRIPAMRAMSMPRPVGMGASSDEARGDAGPARRPLLRG